MIEHISEHSAEYIIAAIGVLTSILTLIIGRSWAKADKEGDNQLRYLDYVITQSPNILSNIADKGMTFKINETVVNSVGIIEVKLYNLTDKDFLSLTIDLTISSTKEITNTKEDLILLSADTKDVNGTFDRVDSTDIQETSNLFKITETIKPVNRSTKPFLHSTFVVQNIEHRNCQLSIKEMGIELREYKEENKIDTISNVATFLYALQTAFAPFIAVGIVVDKLVDFNKRNKANKNPVGNGRK